MVLAPVWVQLPLLLDSVVQERNRRLESSFQVWRWVLVGLLLDEVVVVVGEGGARQGGGTSESVVAVAGVHQPVGAVVGVGGRGGAAGRAVQADVGHGAGQGLAVGVLVEGVAAGGAHRVSAGVLDLGQTVGLVVGVGLRGRDAGGAGVGGYLSLHGGGDGVGQEDRSVGVPCVGAVRGGACGVLFLGHGVAAGKGLGVQAAVGAVAGSEGTGDRVGD